METSHQPDMALSASDMDPEDLRIILDNIEDYLSFWQVLNNEAVYAQDEGLPVSLAQVRAVSDWLKMSSAPLFPSQGVSGLRGVVYRFLNLVIKAFGRPQIHFNRELREYLGEQMLVLQAFNQQAVGLKSAVDELGFRVRDLEAENSDLRQEIEALNGRLAALRASAGRYAGEQERTDRA